jgi:hypothetical protein
MNAHSKPPEGPIGSVGLILAAENKSMRKADFLASTRAAQLDHRASIPGAGVPDEIRLSQCASQALGALLQLAFESVHLLPQGVKFLFRRFRRLSHFVSCLMRSAVRPADCSSNFHGRAFQSIFICHA